MSHKPILLLLFPSIFGEQHRLTRDLGAALEAAGHPVVYFEVKEQQEGLKEAMRTALQQPLSLIVSINAGWAGSIDGESYTDIAGVPQIIWTRQSLGSIMGSVARTRGRVGVLVSDPEQKQFADQRIDIISIKAVDHLPFPARPLAPAPVKDLGVLVIRDAPLERSIDLNTVPLAQRGYVKTLLTRLEAGESLLQASRNAMGLAPDEKPSRLHNLILDFAPRAQLMIQNRWLDREFKRLAKAGVPLTVGGRFWQKMAYRIKPAKTLALESIESQYEAIARARVLLDLDWVRPGGFLETALCAPSVGTPLLTMGPRDLGRFDRAADLVSPEAAPDRLKALCADPGAAAALAERQWADVQSGDLWQHRVGPLLAFSARLGADLGPAQAAPAGRAFPVG